jgi:DNA-binding protein HU-beta
MNKQELCNAVARKTKLPKSKIMAMLDSTFDSISNSLQKGKEVRIVNFGTWKKVKRKARPGRNPQTGKTITIKARNVAKFSMGQNLFDMMN